MKETEVLKYIGPQFPDVNGFPCPTRNRPWIVKANPHLAKVMIESGQWQIYTGKVLPTHDWSRHDPD